jgi:signal transduction histidine kinase
MSPAMNHEGRASLRLRTKLTLLIGGLVIFLVAVTGTITTLREKETLDGELRKRGLALAGDLAIFASRPMLADDLATLRRFVNHSMAQDYVRYVCILDPLGKVVMHSDLGLVGALSSDPVSRTAIASTSPGYLSAASDPEAERIYAIFAPVMVSEARLGTVILGYSRAAAEQEISRARLQIIMLGLLTTISGCIIAFFLSAYISTPIQKIIEAMSTASAGDFQAVRLAGRSDEIGSLASTFNQMAEDLSRHRKHLEVLVEARTSELKNTNYQLELEIAERIKAEEELRRSQEQLRDLAGHIQTIREQERTEIAREIHDELGQALTALKMDLHWLGQRLDGEQQSLAEKIRSMSKMIDATVRAVRRISSELRPKLLDDLGLSAAIEWQALEFQSRSGIQCTIRSDPEDIVIDRPRSTAFFRIFQETLTNIARHSNATRVGVFLHASRDKVEMVVRDNGRGITTAESADAKSLGIVGMRERTLALGGELKITGIAGKGTSVRVMIPASEKGAQG